MPLPFTPQEQPRQLDHIPQHIRDTFHARRSPGRPPGECWPWPCKPGDYGQMRWTDDRGQHQVKTHRLAWMLANGADIPAGLYVLHACNNPPCCNPAHLRLGTHADNMRDARERGRFQQPRPWRCDAPPPAPGRN